MQRQMERELGMKEGAMVGQPAVETVRILLRKNREDLAAALRDEMGMSHEGYIWVRVAVMGEQGQWGEMERFWHSDSKRMDAEPFVVVCLQHAVLEEAQKYVPYVNMEDRFNYAMRCNDYHVAAETAIKQRSLRLLEKVEAVCTDEAVLKYMQRHRGRCTSL